MKKLLLPFFLLLGCLNNTTNSTTSSTIPDPEPPQDLSVAISALFFKPSGQMLKFTVTLGSDFGENPQYNLNTDSTITATSGQDTCTLTLEGASLTQDDLKNPNKITINTVTIPEEEPCDTMITIGTEVTLNLPANLFNVADVESPEYSEEITLL